MLESLGVAAVFSGHSEMFERSLVDTDGDGVGVHYYDVGVAGDGLRGRAIDSLTGEPGGHNPFSVWTADADEPEHWQWTDDGQGGQFLQLLDGGRHYGHLEVDIDRLDSADDGTVALITLTPVYSFPLMDAQGQLIGGQTQRRVYGDVVTLRINAAGQVIPEPATTSVLTSLAAIFSVRRHAKRTRPVFPPVDFIGPRYELLRVRFFRDEDAQRVAVLVLHVLNRQFVDRVEVHRLHQRQLVARPPVVRPPVRSGVALVVIRRAVVVVRRVPERALVHAAPAPAIAQQRQLVHEVFVLRVVHDVAPGALPRQGPCQQVPLGILGMWTSYPA
jgi:hypothetical protein